MTTISDASILAIPTQECGEPLVNLRDHSEFAVHPDNAALPASSLYVRKTLADKLIAAQSHLQGYRLMLVEGLRQISLQASYFDEYVAELQSAHPDWPQDRLHQEASKYVAPPENTPPHSTGGAIDLTLCTRDGRELDMGAQLNATPEDTANAVFMDAANISADARKYREILQRALEHVGLVNYPYQYWHWSHGDRYWAYVTNAEYAVYGAL